jgi:Ala-tRNA(Pro) deacylase
MSAITTEPALLEYLDSHGIRYTRMEHPPVYTCEEAAQYRSQISGVETKNLFLRAEIRSGRAAGQRKEYGFYLVMTACEKRLDLKTLGRTIGASKLQFASEEQLLDALGLTPGSVTVLALVNDPGHRVRLLVDADYWPSNGYLCHPLVNTATLVIGHEDLVRFFGLTGHTPEIVDTPARE